MQITRGQGSGFGIQGSEGADARNEPNISRISQNEPTDGGTFGNEPNADPSSENEPNACLSICPACGCRDLFVRKDFPQRLGLGIVVVAGVMFLILAASRTTFWLGAVVLLAAAAIDAVLYYFVPRITVCYRCRAEFRDVPVNPEHEGYDLAVGEKYRGEEVTR